MDYIRFGRGTYFNDFPLETAENQPLMGMYQAEYDGTELIGKVINTVSVVFPREAFDMRAFGFKDILDIKNNVYNKLLSMVTYLCSKPEICKPLNNAKNIFGIVQGQQQLFFNDERGNGELSKIVAVCEILGNEDDLDSFEGVRFFIHTLDPQVSLNDGLKNLVKANVERSAYTHPNTMKNKKTKGTSDTSGNNSKEDSIKYEEAYKLITSESSLNYEIWSKYHNDFVTSKKLDTNVRNIFDENVNEDEYGEEIRRNNIEVAYNIIDNLSVDKAFKCISSNKNICKKQKEMSEYFDTEDGMGNGSNFIKYPLPERTFKVSATCFHPFQIYSSPLPNFIALQLKNKLEERNKLQKSIGDLELKLNELKYTLDGGVDKATEKAILAEMISIEQSIFSKNKESERIKAELINLTADKIEQDLSSVGDQVVNDTMSFVEEYFAQTNEFLKLKIQIRKRKNTLNEKYPAKQDDETWVKKMEELKLNALQEFWNIFTTSKKIPKIALEGIKWFMKQNDSAKFVERNMIFEDPNNSPFSNMIAKMVIEAEKLLKNYTDFNNLLILLGAAFTSFYEEYKLKANAALSGDGGVGKSFKLDLIQQLFFQGATMDVSNMTLHALDTEQESGQGDLSGIIFLMHEAQYDILGVDKYGNTTSGNPHVKNKLTKGVTATITLVIENGKRIKKIIFNRCLGTTLLCTNEVTQDSTTPLMQRFLPIPVSTKERPDLKPIDMDNQESFTQNEALKTDAVLSWNLITFYGYVWSQLIGCGIFAEINVDVMKHVTKQVMEQLNKQYGIPHPPRRRLGMCQDIARSWTMIYGIWMEFFSELGRKYREDINGDPKPWDFHCLLGLEKWGVINQEIAVFVLTLLEDQWIGKQRLEIAKQAAKVDGVWPPKMDVGKFIMEKETGDIHYIEIYKKDIYSFCEAIKNNFTVSKPSTNDILHALNGLRKEFIESKPRYWQENEYYYLIKKFREIYRSKGNNEVIFKEKNSDGEYLTDSTGEYDDIPLDYEDQMKLVNMYYAICTPEIKRDADSFRNKKSNVCDFVVKQDGHVRKLPIIVIEDVAPTNADGKKNERSKKILISTEFLSKSFDNVLKSCLDVLHHKHAEPQTFITGFLYEGYNLGNIDLSVKETLHQVFQTFELKNNTEKEVIIGNTGAYSELEYKMFYNHARKKNRIEDNRDDIINNNNNNNDNNSVLLTYDDLNPAKRASIFVLDQDIDNIYFAKYFIDNLLDVEESKVSIPFITKHEIWKKREHKDYEEANKNLTESYPDSLIQAIKEKRITALKTNILNDRHVPKNIAPHLLSLPIEELMKLTQLQLKNIINDAKLKTDENELHHSGIHSYSSIILSNKEFLKPKNKRNHNNNKEFDYNQTKNTQIQNLFKDREYRQIPKLRKNNNNAINNNNNNKKRQYDSISAMQDTMMIDEAITNNNNNNNNNKHKKIVYDSDSGYSD
jgi:hypothetical protein